MDWLEFISSILVGYSWPILIVIAFFALRNRFGWLAEQFEEIGLPGGGHVKFRKRLAETQQAAEAAAIEDSGRPGSAIKPDDPFLELAERFPEAAVIESFKTVEAVIQEFAKEVGLKHPANNRVILKLLAAEGYVTQEVYDLFEKVSDTRNAAVHANSRSISSGEAIAYRDLCEQLTSHLRRAFEAREKRDMQHWRVLLKNRVPDC